MRLAYEAAVLDNMTQGRFVLGVGLGQQPVASLFDLGHTSLGDHADEVLSQVRELWTSGTIYPAPIRPTGPTVVRTVDAGPPIAVTYRASESGLALMPALEALTTWAENNLPSCPTA